jgi:hypothetical protein
MEYIWSYYPESYHFSSKSSWSVCFLLLSLSFIFLARRNFESEAKDQMVYFVSVYGTFGDRRILSAGMAH